MPCVDEDAWQLPNGTSEANDPLDVDGGDDEGLAVDAGLEVEGAVLGVVAMVLPVVPTWWGGPEDPSATAAAIPPPTSRTAAAMIPITAFLDPLRPPGGPPAGP